MRKPVYFITSSNDKFQQAKRLIPNLRMVALRGLPEVQSLDIRKIVRQKLEAAANALPKKRPLVVEDTALYLDALNGFPGPLIRFLLESVGPYGIFKLCQKLKKLGAKATSAVGVYLPNGSIRVFTGTVTGHITKPRGTEGFGWDSVFQPGNAPKTFAEMSDFNEREKYSMRIKALNGARRALLDSSQLN